MVVTASCTLQACASRPASTRLTFEVSTYFRSQNVTSFYPEVVVIFTLRDVMRPYHIPLLLSPFGYSTYRGS